MPDVNPQNFEHSVLEADIERLSKEIAEKRNLPEHKKTPEKELIRQTLQPMIKPATSGQAASTQAAATEQKSVLPDYLENSEPEIKLEVEKLIDAVFHQGIIQTIKEAQKSGPFVLDAFHDALTDKLYEELKKRKLI
jgi:F0F1-type ATP synthase membrane subunit b/b'